MERGLQDICAVEGVGGAFVCDNAGDVVASSSPAVLATDTMSHIGRVTAQIFAAMEAANRRVERLEFAFDTWRLFARDLGPAALLVVGHPQVDTAWMRMAVDVAIVEWRASHTIEKKAGKRQVARHHMLKRDQLDDAGWQSLRLAMGA